MFFKPRTPPNHSHHASVTDLDGIGQRSLIRIIFATTGLILWVFCVLLFMVGNYLLASFEAVVGVVLIWGGWRIVRVRNVVPWVYLYLLLIFNFLLYIIVTPGLSSTSFVWVYTFPLMSYLLLGRERGSLLALPFVLLALLLYFTTYPLKLDARSLIDLGNAVLCGVLIIVFVHFYETRRAYAHQQLQKMARTDALTGVVSRGSFQEDLERSILEAQRSNRPLVLVILDVDHFKAVNDQYGHHAGDQALRHICNRLSLRLRQTDLLGRLGGEEFGVLLLNTERDAAVALVEALREQIASAPLVYGEQQIYLTVTMGLAQWPTDGMTAEQLYRCADQRLYRGKAQGRNRLVSDNT